MVRKLLLAAFAALIAGLFAEAVLQGYYKARNGNWLCEDDAFRVGYTQPVEDRRSYSLRPGYRDEPAGIRISELGFREPAVDGKDEPVVVVIGDSVPFGAGVRDDQAYPAVLGRLLQEAGYRVRSVNAGVPSYNLRQSFDRLRLDVFPRYSNVRLVIVQAANDVSLQIYYGAEYTPDLTWADVRWKRTWGNGPFFEKSALFFYTDTAFSKLKRSSARPQKENDSSGRMIDAVREASEEGIALCRERGIPILFMPIDPFYYQTANTERNSRLARWDSSQEAVHLYQGLIESVNVLLNQQSRERQGIFFLDTREALDAKGRDGMYIDFFHYAPEGNRVIAEAIREFIRRHDLLR